ncbi:MAG: hypothetical protein ACTSPB_00495 [Candidatus Thorarchaeota archaeon]
MSGDFESLCEKQGLLWRHCGSCKRKTEHREEDIDKSKYTIVCSKCGRIIKKQRPPMKRVRVSEQYDRGVPLLCDESRACLSRSGHKEYPSCVVHGALLRYEHDIWRCAVCGFAVRWVREVVVRVDLEAYQRASDELREEPEYWNIFHGLAD